MSGVMGCALALGSTLGIIGAAAASDTLTVYGAEEEVAGDLPTADKSTAGLCGFRCHPRAIMPPTSTSPITAVVAAPRTHAPLSRRWSVPLTESPCCTITVGST